MSVFEELAARCEAADVGSVELDADIAAAVRYFPNGVGFVWQSDLKPNSPERGRVECVTSLGTGGPHYKAKCYTMSLDAAMTLPPVGLRLAVSEWDDEKHLRPRGPWQAILTKAGSGSSFNDMLGYRCDHAATPALALCAASLRARAAIARATGEA